MEFRNISNAVIGLLLTVALVCATVNTSFAQPSAGQQAPSFSLRDLKGEVHVLSSMGHQPMLILYFFDPTSKPNLEGLVCLDKIGKDNKNADLLVWAITRSPRDKLDDFLSKTSLGFPVLLDDSDVSGKYSPNKLLPTVCTLGPGGKVLDYYQGGGRGTEMMLLKLAERELQRKQPDIGKAISEQIVKDNPTNLEAKALIGYALLMKGDLNGAEKVFKDLEKEKGGEVLGGLLLIEVYQKKGEPEKALAKAKEMAERAPGQGYPYLIMADALVGQGKKEKAKEECNKAIRNKNSLSHQEKAHFMLAKLEQDSGDHKAAMENYKEALNLNPYRVEAMTGIGWAYEKERKPDRALSSYNEARNMDRNDTFAAVLAKRAEEMVALQKDIERKKRVDALVKELAERFRSGPTPSDPTPNGWTSRPMVMTFLDFQEKGGLAERDGFSEVSITQLTEQLNASGRVKVVERLLMERLLEELNLSASALVDPETSLKLGRILAAKLIGTGSLFFQPAQTLLNLRLIDTETTAIAKVLTSQLSSWKPLDKELQSLSREILKTIMLEYPLCGYVVEVAQGQAMINLGSRHGVVHGTKFEVLEDQEHKSYKGKMLKVPPKPIAQIDIVQVESDISYARILTESRPLQRDDKVREKLEDVQTIERKSAK